MPPEHFFDNFITFEKIRKNRIFCHVNQLVTRRMGCAGSPGEKKRCRKAREKKSLRIEIQKSSIPYPKSYSDVRKHINTIQSVTPP